MEKICEYRFSLQDGVKCFREVMFDNSGDFPIILLHLDGVAPDDTTLRSGRFPFSDAGYDANWMFEALSQKPYNSLFKYNKIIYDFLKARLGGQ